MRVDLHTHTYAYMNRSLQPCEIRHWQSIMSDIILIHTHIQTVPLEFYIRVDVVPAINNLFILFYAVRFIFYCLNFFWCL